MQKNIFPVGQLGIWQIEESEGFFSSLALSGKEQVQLDGIKGRKRVEWLAVRQLLHAMSGRNDRGAVLKDAFGKPFLEHSAWHISMSHSHHRAAVIASPYLVGIDIQFFVEKISRIAHKFMRPEEMDSLEMSSRLEHLHVYWGAKEALYKAYGRKQLDFCTHLLVEPFQLDWEYGRANGSISKDGIEQHFHIHYEKMSEFTLVWVMEVL